jgi:hypothetical protein
VDIFGKSFSSVNLLLNERNWLNRDEKFSPQFLIKSCAKKKNK